MNEVTKNPEEMSAHDKAGKSETPVANRQARDVPDGYRQGLITAITVLLGFSLAFLRYWGLEASGHWTLWSVISIGTLVTAVMLQLIALFRSLRLDDVREREYRKTVRWFIASAYALLLGMLSALIEASTTY